jgi:hypothetical protein
VRDRWPQIAELNTGPAPVEKIISEEEQQRRTQARREQGLRLKAMAENRRKEKVSVTTAVCVCVVCIPDAFTMLTCPLLCRGRCKKRN